MNAPFRQPSQTHALGVQLAQAVADFRLYQDDLHELMLRLHGKDLHRQDEREIDAAVLRDARTRFGDAFKKLEAIEGRLLGARHDQDMTDPDDLADALLGALHEAQGTGIDDAAEHPRTHQDVGTVARYAGGPAVIRFNAELFRICLPFMEAAKNHARIYAAFSSSHIRPAACSWSRPTRIAPSSSTTNKAEADGPAIVPWSGATRPLRPTRGPERRFVQIADGTLSVVTQDIVHTRHDAKPSLTPPKAVHTVPAGLIEDAYPDWRRMVPSGPFASRCALAFDGLYLADFGRAGADLSLARGDRRRPITAMVVLHDGAVGPALIRWPDVDFAFGMLMPRRDAVAALGIPRFFSDRAEAA